MARRISAIIALDGEKEFKQSVMNVNKELTNLKSQSKLTKEEFAGQANTLKALSTKHELLSKTLEIHKKKEKELQNGLDHARETYEKYGVNLEKLKNRYKTAEEKMREMESSSKTTKEQLEAQRREVERLAEGVRGSEERYQTAANRVQDWESKLNTARAQTIKANKELEQNKIYLDEAERSTDKCAKSIDEYGKKVKETTEATLSWETALKGALAGDVAGNMLDAVKELGTSALETAKDMDAAQKQIQASTGASALSMQEYKDVLEDVYKKNYGDNFSDVANTMQIVSQNMDNLSKNDLQNVTEGVITLRDTFDMDLNETVRGTDALVKNMGVDVNEALNLIAKGAQNGLNKSGELGDNIAEYSQLWGQAGFSAEKMFAILDNGLKAGAYNLDKVNDFVKEFTISLSDGRMQDGLSNFSIETQKLFYQWQEGGATAAQVFDSVISDLAGMKNQQEALTIASNTWSALGEDNAMKVITSLNKVNDTYKNVEGTMVSIQNIKYDDISNQMTETARIIQMKIAEPLAKEWLPEINKGLKFAGDNIEVISAASLGLGTLIALNRAKETTAGKGLLNLLKTIFVAKQAENVATEAGTAAIAKRTATSLANTAATAKQAAATKLLTVQQKAYNAVASMTPLGKAALVIGGAVAAYKALQYAVVETDEELVKNREEVKALCDEYDSLKSSIDSAAEQRKENIDGITVEYMSYQTMAEKLVVLAEEENKTSGEMALMHEYVNQLNEAIPSLNLSIDEQTGKLNMTTDALYDQIDAIKEKAIVAAYEETLTDILKEQATAQLELAKLEQEQVDIEKRKKELSEESAEQTLKLQDAMNAAGYSTEWAAAQSFTYYQKLNELEEQEKDVEKRIADCNETIEESSKNFDVVADKIGKMKTETGAATEKMDDLGEKTEDAVHEMGVFADASQNAASTTNEVTKEQATAYAKLKDAVAQNIQQTVSILDEFSGGQKVTEKEILRNLNSQIEGYRNWADNMKTLAGAAGEGMTEEFYSYLVELGPGSANLVQTLVNSLKGESGKFTEICQAWTERMNLDEELPEEVASGFLGVVTEIEKGKKNTMGAMLKAQKELVSSTRNYTKQWSEQNMKDAEKAGLDQTTAQSKGLTTGVPQVQDAAKNVAQTAVQTLTIAGQEAYNTGSSMSTQYAQGINNGAPAAISAAQNLAKSVQQIIASSAGTGKNIGTGITTAIGTNTGTGQSTGSTGISAVGNITKTNQKMPYASQGAATDVKGMGVLPVTDTILGAKKIGVNTAQGIAQGILSEVKSTKASMAELCEEIFEEAKENLDIHSPSRKFKEDIGEMISKGVAFGIAAKKGTAVKNSKALADDVYKAAIIWMDKYKKTNEVSIEDEKYFWKRLSGTVKKGTTSYKNAIKKLDNIKNYQKTVNQKVKSEFKVSWYDEKGEKKKAEDYYDELYQAASKYFSNYEGLHNVSLQQEEYYWEQVLTKMKKGTQGYIDAKKKLRAVQKQMKEQVQAEKDANKEQIQAEKDANKEYALSGGALEAYKTYYQVSEKAEVQYWDIVRKKFKTGTAERIKADQKYYEAKEKYNDKLEELNEEYYENCQEVKEKLTDDINELTSAYNDSVAERKSAIYSSFGLFDQFQSTSASGSTLLYNLRSQVAGIADWEQQLQKLGNKNILSDGLLEELANMGPEASASIHALNQLSEQELREYEKLWEQKNALAESQAVKENEQLRKETQNKINELKVAAQQELDAYKEAYQKAVAEVKKGIEKPLKNLATKANKIGEDAVAEIIKGIKNKATKKDTSAEIQKVNTKISKNLGKLEKAGKTIGNNTLQGILDGLNNTKKINKSAKSLVDALKKAMQKEADIHSPSRLFKREIGVNIADGVAAGILDESKVVNRAGVSMIQDLIKQQEAQMQKKQQELQVYAASVTSQTGMSELNRLLSVAPVQQVSAQLDNTSVLAMMDQMIAVMQEGFKNMENIQIVADTGALIGETSVGMSEQFAKQYRRMRR